MLSRLHRLNKEKEINQVFKRGKAFFSKKLGIKTLANDLKISRFCFVVGNKVSKKATQRNRLKRQMREIIRLNLAKIQPGYDLIIMARAGSGVLDKSYQELEKELLWLLKKSGLLG